MIQWYDIISIIALILILRMFLNGENETNQIAELFGIVFKIIITIVFVAIWGGIFYW